MQHRLVKGDKFKIDEGYHAGRTYTVEAFAPDKWGIVHAVCGWDEQNGYKSSFTFTERDLNEFGTAFRMYWSASEDLDAELYTPRPNTLAVLKAKYRSQREQRLTEVA